jgi:hypothetical protein
MVTVAIPGERWEVEFFANCTIEIERFKSTNGIGGEESLTEIFAAYEDEEKIPVLN